MMEGKCVLVTGAASGIGAEVAKQSRAAGARVALLDIDNQAGTSLAESLGSTFFDCDVASYKSMRQAVSGCCDQMGVPDYVHLNAGIMTVSPGEPFLAIEDVTLDQYQRILDINLGGVFHGLKLLIPLMRERGGAITITASTAGMGVLPIDPLYAMTKCALIGLGRSVAAANMNSNLRVNIICPGVVDTAIVPEPFKAFGMMPTADMAKEIISLMTQGGNGEVRVKVKDRPGFSIEPQDQSFKRLGISCVVSVVKKWIFSLTASN